MNNSGRFHYHQTTKKNFLEWLKRTDSSSSSFSSVPSLESQQTGLCFCFSQLANHLHQQLQIRFPHPAWVFVRQFTNKHRGARKVNNNTNRNKPRKTNLVHPNFGDYSSTVKTVWNRIQMKANNKYKFAITKKQQLKCQCLWYFYSKAKEHFKAYIEPSSPLVGE